MMSSRYSRVERETLARNRGYDEGAADERARIVAWLRGQANMTGNPSIGNRLRNAANEIEHGEHDQPPISSIEPSDLNSNSR